jgi:hypothetical protein
MKTWMIYRDNEPFYPMVASTRSVAVTHGA